MARVGVNITLSVYNYSNRKSKVIMIAKKFHYNAFWLDTSASSMVVLKNSAVMYYHMGPGIHALHLNKSRSISCTGRSIRYMDANNQISMDLNDENTSSQFSNWVNKLRTLGFGHFWTLVEEI